MDTPLALFDAAGCAALHQHLVARWHELAQPLSQGDALAAARAAALPAPPRLAEPVLLNHLHNFRLWHYEDEARRPGAPNARIARMKRAIDTENQRRNDAIERIDDELLALLAGRGVEPRAGALLHSETPGSMVDRLSILSLKRYHTAEQARRPGATAEHRARCRARLELLDRQRADLGACLARQLAQIAAGEARMVVYRHLKMYNDPALNPVFLEPVRPRPVERRPR